MAPRPRSAQKRPLALEGIDSDSASNDSDGSVSDWQPVSSPTSAEAETVTSSASEESGQICVLASPPQETQFQSWKDFEAYLALYQAQSLQIFRVRTNTSVAVRNARIDAQGSAATKIPAEWDQYAKTYVCTHHGTYRSQATSKRPRQETRAQGCSAQLNVCVQEINKAEHTFVLKVTKCRLEHNHSLNEYAFKSHPSNRITLDDSALRTVNELRKAGAKKTSILKFIRDNSDSNPKPQDVHNLVSKLKARENRNGPSSSAKRLKKWMAEFGDNVGNVGRIFVDDVGEKKIATCITLQTKHMRSVYKQFPEVLLIDATHGTNRSKYKVFSFMAHDTFGKGQFVQHALLQNERWPTLLTALEEFKSNNPAWTKLRCVLIDKDFTELSVLKTAFPDVTTLLCQFHVLKYLREEIASADYGCNTWEKDQLRGLMNLLVYAKTEKEYMKHFRYMLHVCGMGRPRSGQLTSDPVGQNLAPVGQNLAPVGQNLASVGQNIVAVGQNVATEARNHTTSESERCETTNTIVEPFESVRHPFVAYFIKNWDKCRELWCAHKRQNTVTLGNNTNNRLEASWKQLKEWVNSFMAVDECIASIMYYQSLQERRFMDEVYKKVNVQHVGYDREMTLVANLVSEHTCELIHDQYCYALDRASYAFSERAPGVYFVKSTSPDEDALDEVDAEYTITTHDWTCSCLFMSTRLLPCRHVFFLRRALNKETVIPTQLLHQRWVLSSVRSSIEFENASDAPTSVESFAVRRVLVTDERPWDSNRKYREALPIASEFCDSMAGLGMVQYREAMAYLKAAAHRFKVGDFSSSIKMPTISEGTRDDVFDSDTVGEVEVEDPELLLPGLLQPSTQITPQSGESGTQSVESGIQSEESGIQSGESGSVSAELICQTGAETSASHATLQPVGNDTFDVASPPRSRGRPKQSAKSKKAARRKNVLMVQDDSNLYSDNLSLATIQDAVRIESTYETSAAIVSKFKLFDFTKNPRAPVAHKVARLPASKKIVSAESIPRIFRKDILDRCSAKVLALQKAHKESSDQNLGEKDIVVEIVGVGTYSTETLGVMKKWHKAMKTIQYVEKAIVWIDTIDFELQMPRWFCVDLDPDTQSKIKSIPLLSAEALELVGKSALGDSTVNKLMLKLFAAREDTIAVDTSIAGNVMNGFLAVETMKDVFAGMTNQKILIPVICNKNHWCAVMMDLSLKEVFIYDPMSSSYGVKGRPLAEKMVALLPDFATRKYRIRPYTSELGVQVDSYNCGIYMLLAFEIFAGAENLYLLSRKELQYLRYRYLCMCI